MSSSRIIASVLAATAVVTFASAAAAQDPAPPALPAPAQPAPPASVAPAPVAAAAAPSPSATPITATCSLGAHEGIDPAEAHTAADVLCHELARQGATNAQHEIRMGKLGGKILVTLAARNGQSYDERRAFVSGMEEISVAAPRLVSSLVEGKSVADTRDVDNVLTAEQRQAKVQRGQMGFDGAIFGMTGIGADSGSAAGLDLGLLYRAGSFGLGAHGRAGGIGSSDNKLGSASLDIGGRYYLTNSDIAPFAGGGVALSYFQLNRERNSDLKGSGLGAYAQVGAEMFRTHHMALAVSLRMDMPFYELQGSTYTYSQSGPGSRVEDKRYVMPLSLNVGFVFH